MSFVSDFYGLIKFWPTVDKAELVKHLMADLKENAKQAKKELNKRCRREAKENGKLIVNPVAGIQPQSD